MFKKFWVRKFCVCVCVCKLDRFRIIYVINKAVRIKTACADGIFLIRFRWWKKKKSFFIVILNFKVS